MKANRVSEDHLKTREALDAKYTTLLTHIHDEYEAESTILTELHKADMEALGAFLALLEWRRVWMNTMFVLSQE